VGQHT